MAAAVEEQALFTDGRSKRNRHDHDRALDRLTKDMQTLLDKIEDAVPLINLAITTSGAKLTTQLPASVSPSRLLQASMFLTEGDHRFSVHPDCRADIKPTFTVSVYMLFAGHSNRMLDEESGQRKTTWKEVFHKAQVKLVRMPRSESRDHVDVLARDIPSGDRASEYSYHLEMIEDLDDGRIHTMDDKGEAPASYGDVQAAGMSEHFPIHQVSRIFYADTGKILNIGNDTGSNNPVLLLKRDIHARAPRRMMEHVEVSRERDDRNSNADCILTHDDYGDQINIDEQLQSENGRAQTLESKREKPRLHGLPADLDPEWIAFEVYRESAFGYDEDSSSGSSTPSEHEQVRAPTVLLTAEPSVVGHTLPTEVESSFKSLSVLADTESPSRHSNTTGKASSQAVSTMHDFSPFSNVQSSLSLLEVLIRLTVLQQHQQQSHLSIPDEYLTFFLQEASTTGMDGEERRRMRREARTKVGFDPYDESPVKPHGEEYQRQAQAQPYSRGSTPFDASPRHDLRQDSSGFTPHQSPGPR